MCNTHCFKMEEHVQAAGGRNEERHRHDGHATPPQHEPPEGTGHPTLQE